MNYGLRRKASSHLLDDSVISQERQRSNIKYQLPYKLQNETEPFSASPLK